MIGQPPGSVHEAALMLRRHELTVTDLIDSVLQVAEQTEPIVHAFSYLDPEAVRAAAVVAEDQLRAGQDRGPLHGIPIGIKDVILTADLPTTGGSRAIAPLLGQDARVVELLKNAGAIIIGKQVTHEFVAGQDEPPTRNAWNQACYPGGSTAGGGVSVAVGSSLAALGTDAGGSVRKPAALNGVVGLKPTFGRVSRQGVLAPSGSMDHIGVVTRSVRDLPLLMQALCHRDLSDTTLIDEEIPDFAIGEQLDLRGVRLGVSDYFTGEGCTPEVAAAFETAVGVLAEAGAIIVPVDIPTLVFSLPTGAIINQAEGGRSQRDQLNASGAMYGTRTRRFFETGAILPQSFVDAAGRARHQIVSDFRRAFESSGIEALLTPTTGLTAIPLSQMVIDRDLPRYVRFTIVANLTGLPAVTVPCGFIAGLPTGLQLIGRPFQEPRLIQIAQAYETRSSWLARRPSFPPVPPS